MKYPKIGLDIDNVLNEWTDHFFFYLGLDRTPCTDWHDSRIRDNFDKIRHDLDFWKGIPRQVEPSEILVPPHCYCTARPIDSKDTALWLSSNGFPEAEVRTVGYGGNKVDYLKDVDFFLDDAIHNFEELNNAGINCYLYTQSHNKDYVTDKRVNNLKEFFDIVLGSVKTS